MNPSKSFSNSAMLPSIRSMLIFRALNRSCVTDGIHLLVFLNIDNPKILSLSGSLDLDG